MITTVAPLLLFVALAAAETVTIPELGTMEGGTGTSTLKGRTYYRFQGVPYVERPERFQPPVKKAPWEGVLNAKNHGRMCPQRKTLNNGDKGDVEDCLFLSVYTPTLDKDAKLPVLFFVHGGAFIEGYVTYMNPGFLMDQDIVVVLIQYRLGPLGFLSLGVDGVPGNAGMYDQVAALQWTYDYIKNFGGDPEKITVGGFSAGATSAGLLYVSPLTQGIVKQVIMCSGSATSSWAVGQRAVSDGLDIARYGGCDASNGTDALVSCLKNKDPLDLIKGYYSYQADERKKGHSEMRGVNPVVDGRFLDKMPEEIMKSPSFKGRPMIMSVDKHEGALWEPVIYSYLNDNNLLNDNKTLRYGVPDILLAYTDVEDLTGVMATAVEEEFFKPEQLGDYSAMKPGIIDYIGAAYFKGPARKMAELNAARGGATYLAAYHYAIQGKNTGGVVEHGADQLILFIVGGVAYKDADYDMVEKVTSTYANFFATGTPSGVTWPTYSLETGQYLIINTTMSIGTSFTDDFTVAVREGF